MPTTIDATRPALTPEVRARIGLHKVKPRAYPWKWALFLCAIAAGPLWFAELHAVLASVCALALVVLPAISKVETRDVADRERLYRTGREAFARVVEVEPPGDGRRDHVVRFDFFTGESAESRVVAAVVGSPLALRGLKSGEEIVIVYDPAHPTRCLVIDRAARPGSPLGGATERLLH